MREDFILRCIQRNGVNARVENALELETPGPSSKEN